MSTLTFLQGDALYSPNAHPFGMVNLGDDRSLTFSTRQSFDDYLENYINYNLEKLYLPFIADVTHMAIGGLSGLTSAMKEMQDFFKNDSKITKTQQHVLTFAYDFESSLPSLIKQYKASVAYRQEGNQQIGIPTHDQEAAELRQNPRRNWTYHTGNINQFFRDAVTASYKRAQFISNWVSEYGSTSWAALSINSLMKLASARLDLNNSVTFEHTNLSSYLLRAIFDGRSYDIKRVIDSNSQPAAPNPIAIRSDDFDDLTLRLTSTYSGTDAILRIKNFMNLAVIVNLGTSSKTEKGIIHPVEMLGMPKVMELSVSDVRQVVSLEVFPPPQPIQTIRSVRLAINGQWSDEITDYFTGRDLGGETAYPRDSRIIRTSVENGRVTVDALAVGETILILQVENLSGTKQVKIPVTVFQP